MKKAAKKRTRKPNPFAHWRLLSQDGSRRFSIETKDGKTWLEDKWNDKIGVQAAPFDELVVHDLSIHLERMDTRALWMRIGPATFWLSVDRKGKVKLTMTEGSVDQKTGEIT